MDPYDVFRCHVTNDDRYHWRAASIASKYAGIKSWMDDTETGISLYEKFKHNKFAFHHKFSPLIRSISRDGFSEDSPILLGCHAISSLNLAQKPFLIEDGAHRLACCLYFNIPVNYLVIGNTQMGADGPPHPKATEDNFTSLSDPSILRSIISKRLTKEEATLLTSTMEFLKNKH